MQELAGKVAFITGGGSGVGLGQAKVFVREGMKVAIADIRKDHLDEAMAYFREIGADVHPLHMDITDRRQMEEAAQEVERVFGRPVQLLCNTAGVSIFGPLQNATFEDWEWVLNVNVWGVINGLQTFVPRMIRYGQGGHVVNTSSMAGMRALPGAGIYVASKYAVRGLTEVLRMDLEPHGIGVSLLCPKAVNTNIHEAVLTRPAHLANTGYYQADEEVFQRLKKSIEVGMDPVTLAEHVLRAVRNNDLYVIPYPEAADDLIAAHERVLAVIPPKESDPDWVKRVERMQRRS
ncbi:MAG: SDR family NAD(P)-dependent oxidoreductase [Alicyclobacillaceae bacterium]|nr:SDR family NAD(P)-dependent oxidoreductase [Alicyclobacillaceae bacterium]